MRKASIYNTYSQDELNELNSRFLITAWSYSKVTSFARNEKAFEMNYIYGERMKSSATTIAGTAYHEALKFYWEEKQKGRVSDIVQLEAIAFQEIQSVPANKWKLQKTTPTVDEARNVALKTVTDLLRNFMKEKSIYEDNIKEIVAVEVFCSEFLTINGVDIPMICSGKIDLIVKTMEDKFAIVDHKSKKSFTPEDEMKLAIGVQAITYVNLYEENSGLEISEVWFVENKASQNKDKSAQLILFKVEIDENSRRLYEALLYEPLRRMLEAVSNPDHVYLINDSDNYVDRAELYDFWCKTQISEIDDFNVEESKKELVSKRLRKIRDASMPMVSPNVIKRFKENAAQFIKYDLSTTDMTIEQKIEHVLRTFGISVNVAHTFPGYSSSTCLLEVSAGVKIASITPRSLDLANALDVSNVRLSKNLVVYEGKSYVSLDFEKKKGGVLAFDPAALQGYKIPLGKDNFGNVIHWDLQNQSTPHALICGATGSGKSVCVRNIIEYAIQAGGYDIIILDPKYEFIQEYSGMRGIKVVSDIQEIEDEMAWQVLQMNELVKENKTTKTLIVFDEFADAFANSRSGKELDVRGQVIEGMYANGLPKVKTKVVDKLNSLEENLRILLQKGRSVGLRIVAATQRASTKIISGDLKVNLTVQICFRVQKEVDSMVVLDEAGAEALAGKGDGLIKSPEYPDTVRFQAFFKEVGVTA